jgi:hypothetical protein
MMHTVVPHGEETGDGRGADRWAQLGFKI